MASPEGIAAAVEAAAGEHAPLIGGAVARWRAAIETARSLRRGVARVAVSVRRVNEAFVHMGAQLCRAHNEHGAPEADAVTRFAQRQADAAHAGAASTLPALETDAVALCDSWVARLEDTGARLPELLPLSRAVEHYAGKLRAIEQGKPSATNRRAAEAHADQLGRARAKYEQAVRDYACGELVVTDDIDQSAGRMRQELGGLLEVVRDFEERWTRMMAAGRA